MVWARLYLACAIGVGAGGAGYFLSLGLLPEFPASGQAPTSGQTIQFPGGYAILPPISDSPEIQADKRRFATAIGIGCAAAALTMTTVFIASRRWVLPHSKSLELKPKSDVVG